MLLRCKHALALLLLVWAGLLLATGASHAGDAPARPIVVELFTSQGCDSCPPADAVLAQLADRKDLIALTLPVTYWDMLGWRDTLASDANTRRQKGYAEAMGHGGVYTPEMIVDGITDTVGNKQQTVDAAIAERMGDPDLAHVTLRAAPDAIHIAVAPASAPLAGDATIWLFDVMSKATVKVGAGENGGHTLFYRNVVRDMKSVGLWKGQSFSVSLPAGDAPKGYDSIAVIVQQGGYGRILGAAAVARPAGK
jgi:hypothetical protein